MTRSGYIFILLVIFVSTVVTTSSKYNLTKHLSIEWEFYQDKDNRDENSIRLTIRKNKKGWAAFGFGKSMLKSEILLLEKISTTSPQVNVSNCYLYGYTGPNCLDIVQGWKTEKNIAKSDYSEVTLTRSLIQKDLLNGQNVYREGNYILFAYSDSDKIEIHYDSEGAAFGQLNLDFTTGKTFIENGLKWGFIRHEYYQLTIWTILADTLMVLARYFKWVQNYAEIHMICFAFILLMSYFAQYTDQVNIISNDPEKWAQHGNNIHIHAHYSDYMMPIVLFQWSAGILIRILSYFRGTPIKVKQIFRYIHLIGGLVIWLLSRFVVFYGTFLYWKKYENVLLLIYCILETIGFILAVVYLQLKASSSANEDPITGNGQQLQTSLLDGSDPSDLGQDLSKAGILKDIRSNMSKYELEKKYPGKFIMTFKNGVYDLTGFNHPGGAWRFEEANWTEVSRYLLGISGIEKDGSESYKHSNGAMKVLNNRHIGNLYSPSHGSKDDWAIKLSKDGNVAFTNADWTLSEKVMVSSTTSLFKWQNPEFKIDTGALGYKWMGKHYMVSKQGKTSKIRLYTHCVSLSDEVRAYDEKVLQLFYQRVRGEQEIEIPQMPQFIDYLPMVMKRYESTDGISKIVHSLSEGEKIKIEGPFGRGFILDEQADSEVVIIAGGTGILPFVDFLAFLLKIAISKALESRGKMADFLQPKQRYSDFFPGVRFHLFCSFRTEEDFIFKKEIENLVTISKEYGLNLFNCVSKVDNIDPRDQVLKFHKGHFDRPFFESNLPEILAVRSVFVCGPQKMHSQMFNVLHNQMKIPANRISYV